MPGGSKGPRRLWKHLWKLNLPLKVIHLVWSCCKKFLPCAENLIRMKLPVSGLCIFCGLNCVSLIHLMKYCMFSRRRWKLDGFSVKIYKIDGESCLDWIEAVCNAVSMVDFSRFCAILWMLWFDHNRVNHGERPLEDRAFMAGVDNVVVEVADRGGEQRRQRREGMVLWLAPVDSIIKLNCDAAFFADGGWGFAGFLVRDFRGDVLMCGTCPLGRCWSALHAELLAILNGLVFASHCGIERIVVSSDCEVAVEAILAARDVSYMDVVVNSIRSIASSFFESNFIFEGRAMNIAADELAKWGSSLVGPQFFRSGYPVCLSACIDVDRRL
ncbi:uncharacterized protein [Euphorbia lathyris]|uniref:uncharacterized protein n=1 Tax=Euphorbia lathyris TaxID=212925 RepID=UPI0033144BF1